MRQRINIGNGNEKKLVRKAEEADAADTLDGRTQEELQSAHDKPEKTVKTVRFPSKKKKTTSAGEQNAASAPSAGNAAKNIRRRNLKVEKQAASKPNTAAESPAYSDRSVTAKHQYGVLTADREESLRKLASGGYVGKRTRAKTMFSSPMLPPLDVKTMKRKIRIRNIIPNIITAICLAIAIIGVSGIVIHMNDLKRDDAQMEQVANVYTTTPTTDTTYLPPAVDWASIKRVNEEISGWIYIPNTNVNYPVLTSAEPEKYLRMDMYYQYKVSGSIFTDWTNLPDYSDRHIVIYGHHLPSDTMFTPVSRYIDGSDFFDTHKTIYIETPTLTYELAVVGAYRADPEEVDAVNTAFMSDMDFQGYLDERISRCEIVDTSVIDRRVADKLFTLVTCTESGAARAIVEAIPVKVYSTDLVPQIRGNAGAAITTVTVTDEQVQEDIARTGDESDGSSNPYVEWIQEIMLRIAEWEIPFV